MRIFVTNKLPEVTSVHWHGLAIRHDADGVPGVTGPAVAAGLAARRWLADHPEAAVLDRAWRCAPDVLEERYGVPGAADPAVIRLTQGGGLRRTVTLDTVGAAVIGVGDGSLTAGQALTAVCAILREDPCAHRAQVIDLLRTLIADALLIPADGVPTPGG